MSREEQVHKYLYEHDGIWEWGSFIAGQEWADNNPRTDIIGVDSISFIRRILVSKFVKIARLYPNTVIDDVPEMKQAFDMIVNFDEACESAGYVYDDENGIYVMK